MHVTFCLGSQVSGCWFWHTAPQPVRDASIIISTSGGEIAHPFRHGVVPLHHFLCVIIIVTGELVPHNTGNVCLVCLLVPSEVVKKIGEVVKKIEELLGSLFL